MTPMFKAGLLAFVIAAFIMITTIVYSPAKGGEMLTPACAPLEDVVNATTIKSGTDDGATYVKLEGDEAVKVSNRLQDLNDEPHMKVDRIDFLFFPASPIANVVSSYSGCIQEATHIKLDLEHLERMKVEGSL